MPFAPPSGDQLLSRVAELVLRSKLRKCEFVNVKVRSNVADLLAGVVSGVEVLPRSVGVVAREATRAQGPVQCVAPPPLLRQPLLQLVVLPRAPQPPLQLELGAALCIHRYFAPI